MRLWWRWTAGALALALAPFGCNKSAADAGTDVGAACVPPPLAACPDGGGPSFEGDVLPVFKVVCDNCHAPDASQPQTPLLTNYQQIYGPVKAGEVVTRVFDDCSMPMPPATATVQLSDDERLTLLAWLTCGAHDSPAVDTSAD